MSAYSLPAAAHVKDLLGALFDGLKATPCAKINLSPQSKSYVAVYVSDYDAVIGLCACDLALAARTGAALSMLPPNAALECIKSQQLDGPMSDNLREVMNICTRLLLREGAPHLRLERVYEAKELPAATSALVAGARRIDFELELDKYGKGALAVLLVG